MKQYLYSFDLDHNRSQGVIIHLLIELDARKVAYKFEVESHGPAGGNPHVRITTRLRKETMSKVLEHYVGDPGNDAWMYEPTDLARLVFSPADVGHEVDWHDELWERARDGIAHVLERDPAALMNPNPTHLWVMGHGQDDWDLLANWGDDNTVYVGSFDRQDISPDLAQCLDEDDENDDDELAREVALRTEV